ncbi:MAG: CtsR family transcriptional regulator [Ruminococcaceae bacterium]|nr:CtsR family transcriptional regulator [Oscillospiraceae bacterium]
MLADMIARMIEEMLNEGDGTLELQRNEMASRIGCVPSQISYVISSRFTPERGYVIESRRGGGGCIRIVRKQMNRDEYLMHFFCAIGDEIEEAEANAYLKNLADHALLSDHGYRVARAALSNAALASVIPSQRNRLRAEIFKQMALALM